MNSLYGRFNPESTITEICTPERYEELMEKTKIIDDTKLSDYYYLVSYRGNTPFVDDSDWDPPRISAVQLAAAITACARIHMYKYISREDCYYTDTDSAVLGSPLPDDEVSPIELGKLKLEYRVLEGYFLAPKTYHLQTSKNENLIKRVKNSLIFNGLRINLSILHFQKVI